MLPDSQSRMQCSVICSHSTVLSSQILAMTRANKTYCRKVYTYCTNQIDGQDMAKNMLDVPPQVTAPTADISQFEL